MFGDGSIWPHVSASAEIAALGFVLSILVGVPLGLPWAARSLMRDDARAVHHGARLAASRLPAAAHHLARHRHRLEVALVFLGAFFIIVVNTEAGVGKSIAG